MRWHSPSPAETGRAGRALGAVLLEAGACVVALCGPLGAGKTRFAKGVAEGLGIDPALVSSPTFVIANELSASEGGPRLVHADLYRLESVAELEAAGWLDWLDGKAWLLVEWADRFPAELPDDHLAVHLEPVPGEAEGRRFHVHAGGPRAADVLARWLRGLEIA